MKPNPDFLALVHRYLDGSLTAVDLEQLNDRLRSDPSAMTLFLELLNLDSALEAVALDVPVDQPAMAASFHSPKRQAISRRTIVRLAAGMTACLLLGFVVTWWQGFARDFATVVSSEGVQGLAKGTPLRGEEHEIQAGTLNVVTPRGVKIVIEAPALFRFESGQRLHLMRGRVAADVPNAGRKFTVITPSGEAVDLGTKFGVVVPPKGDAEVHVFQGEVIAQSASGGTRQSLHDGEAFRLQPGAGNARDLRSAAFIRPEEVKALHAALRAGQRVHSEAALERLRRDPALIALLDFESAEIPEGTYELVQGRWPGSRAPEFVHAGDHMKIDVGGDHAWPQLTLAAWVRLDRIDSRYHSLLHTDGWGNPRKIGQVHWTVTNEQKMRLAMFGSTLSNGEELESRYPFSRTPVAREQGRWVHLTAVFDADRRSVRFYFDGKLDNVNSMDLAHPIQLGPAQIGNWNQSDRKLGGRIDELLILGRAMSDEEVQELYRAGNPYR